MGIFERELNYEYLTGTDNNDCFLDITAGLLEILYPVEHF